MGKSVYSIDGALAAGAMFFHFAVFPFVTRIRSVAGLCANAAFCPKV
jgi:hypothetical protein